jgi:glycosidase
MLNHYKTFMQLRNASKALTFGELEAVDMNNKALLSYIRTAEGESALIIHNLSSTELPLTLPAAAQGYNKISQKHKDTVIKNGTGKIAAYSTLILQK